MRARLMQGRVAVPFALAVLAAVAVVVAISSVGTDPVAGSAERTVTAATGVVQSTVSGSGNLAPANELDLSFGASGEVTKVYVRAGDHVHQGQLLAKIDPSSAEVDLAEANATLQSAQDALTTASAPPAPATTTPASATTTSATATSAARTTAAATGGSGSGGTSVASATAAVKSAQLSVAKAEKALAATKLHAPLAGTIAAVNGAVGDTVGSGSSASGTSGSADTGSAAAVAGGLGGSGAGSGSGSGSSSSNSGFITLAQLSRYTMDVALSESDIGRVKVGQQATVTVNAASGAQFAARVQRVGVLASSSSGSSAVSYPVTLRLAQTGSKLKAGMSATADIVVSEASGVAVPSQAVQGGSVTVVRNGKRTTQRVQTGVVGDASTQILSGLKAGDAVVVRSASAAAGANATGAGGSGAAGAAGRGGGLGGGGAVLIPGGGAGFGGGGFRAGGGGQRFRAGP